MQQTLPPSQNHIKKDFTFSLVFFAVLVVLLLVLWLIDSKTHFFTMFAQKIYNVLLQKPR